MVFPRIGTTDFIGTVLKNAITLSKLTICFGIKTFFEKPMTDLMIASFQSDSKQTHSMFFWCYDPANCYFFAWVIDIPEPDIAKFR